MINKYSRMAKHEDSTIEIIFGDRGSGKTLWLTRAALKSHNPFFSNYKIYQDKDKEILHPRYNELHIEDILHMNNEVADLLITEGYEYFENRLGMGALERYMSYMIFQSRKKHKNLFIDTQLPNTVDNRLLGLVDYILYAEVVPYGFHYYCTDRKIINEFDIPIIDAEKIWNKYDSWEVVTTPQIEQLGRQMEVQMNKPKLKENLKKLEDIFREEYKNIDQKRITHGLIENFMLDHDDEFPNAEAYESFLYARLQKPKGVN
jgi:hypothetical protein